MPAAWFTCLRLCHRSHDRDATLRREPPITGRAEWPPSAAQGRRVRDPETQGEQSGRTEGSPSPATGRATQTDTQILSEVQPIPAGSACRPTPLSRAAAWFRPIGL